MRALFQRFVPRLLAALAIAALTGCSSLHGWTQFGSNHSPRAGASVSVPLGR